MAITRKDAEFQYYSRVAAALNIPANSPLSHFKRAWWAHAVGSTNNQETSNDLEFRFLGTFTGVNGKTIQDRWMQAFIAVSGGVKPPGTMEELQAMFYQLAP